MKPFPTGREFSFSAHDGAYKSEDPAATPSSLSKMSSYLVQMSPGVANDCNVNGCGEEPVYPPSTQLHINGNCSWCFRRLLSRRSEAWRRRAGLQIVVLSARRRVRLFSPTPANTRLTNTPIAPAGVLLNSHVPVTASIPDENGVAASRMRNAAVSGIAVRYGPAPSKAPRLRTSWRSSV